MANNLLYKVFWSIGQRYLPSLIQITCMLFITRLISPSDFGEVAIVTTFSHVAMLVVSSGLSEGLIFKDSCSNLTYTSVFYFNIGIALSLYLTFFIFSDTIADFYELPRLSTLTKVISLNLLAYAASYVQRTIMQKKLEFKRLMIISFVSTLLACVISIIMALNGMGMWAIVSMTLLINVFESIALWSFSSWRPMLKFSLKEVWKLLPYSIRLLFNNFVQTLYDNIYSLVIGKFLGSQSLGYYNRMQTVVYYTTTNFMYSIESVFFPVLCKNKESNEHLNAAYEKLLRICVMLSSIVLLFMILFPKQIVVLVLTEKWIDASPILMLLSIAFLFVPISYINNSFLKIKNRTSILLCSNIIKKIIGVLLLIFSISSGNIEIICKVLIGYYFADAIISMVCAHKWMGISLINQFKYLLNSAICIALSLIIVPYITRSVISNVLCILSGGVVVLLIFLVYNCLFYTKEKTIALSLLNRRK